MKEGDVITVTVVTDGDFTVPFNVTLALNGTATGELFVTMPTTSPTSSLYILLAPLGGADFDVSGFPTTVTLFPGMTSVNISLTTTADGIIECTECLDIILTVPASSSELGVNLGSPTTVNTCILDADGSELCVCTHMCLRTHVCLCTCVHVRVCVWGVWGCGGACDNVYCLLCRSCGVL